MILTKMNLIPLLNAIVGHLCYCPLLNIQRVDPCLYSLVHCLHPLLAAMKALEHCLLGKLHWLRTDHPLLAEWVHCPLAAAVVSSSFDVHPLWGNSEVLWGDSEVLWGDSEVVVWRRVLADFLYLYESQ